MKKKAQSTSSMMQHDIEIFKRVLSRMPQEFTSNAMTARMKASGVTGQIIASQNLLLHYLCTPLSEKLCKTWRKKPFAEPSLLIEPTPQPKPTPPTEEECIAILKSTGKYKISRVTWEEI